MKKIKQIFTTKRLYLAIIAIILLFIAGFYFEFIWVISKIALLSLGLLLFMDIYLLFFTKDKILISRELPNKFSNGDDNIIEIHVKNQYRFPVSLKIIDEIPVQFQIRDFQISTLLKAGEEKHMQYTLKPLQRGEYEFGKVKAYTTSYLKLICRRFTNVQEKVTVPVYPCFLRMHQYRLLAFTNRLTEVGVTKVRKIGHHTEFEQIRNYVKGDEFRTINWKATARRAKLMVNQYMDERSQQIYNIIDMGRTMKMPFEGMTLLDYAINASLIISDTVLYKYDKSGLITYNTTINTFLPAERKNNTMSQIMEALYNQTTAFDESSFDLLYTKIKRSISHRSLLVLYTNFESLTSLRRHLPYLIKLASVHLVLVVIFKNTEIKKLTSVHATKIEDIYIQTIAEKFMYEKKLIAKELQAYGIQSILTEPGDLTIQLINKYLTMKSRGIL